jgi:hypothetical protein
MPRQKRGSKVLEYSEQRITVLKSIAMPELDGELSVPVLLKSIEQTRAKLNEYNATLSIVDQLSLEVREMERSLVTLNDRMLSSVAAKYGRDSAEYARVGSIRRKAKRRVTPVAQPEAVAAN